MTAPEIAADFNLGRSKPVSVTTIKRRLPDAELKGCRAVTKLLFTANNKNESELDQTTSKLDNC